MCTSYHAYGHQGKKHQIYFAADVKVKKATVKMNLSFNTKESVYHTALHLTKNLDSCTVTKA